jgi:putative inorganic carbon (HCO3(-)) transporter
MNIISNFLKNKKIDWLNILNGIIEFSYLGIVFFIPLYFAFFITNYNIFELNKTVLFNILTSLFLVCFLIKYLFYPYLVKQELPGRKLKYLAIPLFFLFTLVLSAIFSDFQELSFFGLYSRQQGLINFVYYFVFFVLLVFHIKESWQIRRILKTVGYSSFLVAGYGILQVSGWGYFSWMEDPSVTGRVFSSLGQPNYLGSFLLLVIPVAWYLFHTAQKRSVKFWWIAVLLLQIVCLYFTLSRGAYLGFIAGAVAGGVFYYRIVGPSRTKGGHQRIGKGKRRFFALSYKFSLFFLAVIFLLSALLMSPLGQKSIQRLSNSFNLEQGSVAFRLDLWKKAGQAAQQAPFFGYGLDTQKEVFFKYYQKDWGVFADVNVAPSRAHNFILDRLLTTGFLGLFSYLALLYLFIKILFTTLKSAKPDDDPLEKKAFGLAIFVSLFSYLISIFFHFSTVVTQVYFWLYLALAIIVYDLEKTENEKEPLFRRAKEEVFLVFGKLFYFLKRKKIYQYLRVLIVLLLIVGFGFQFQKQLNHLVADHYYTYMKTAYARQDYFRIFELYDYIDQLNVRERRYDREAVLMVSDFIDNADSQNYKKVGFDKVKPALENIRSSSSFQDVYAQAKIYSALADKNHRNYFGMAEEKFQILLEKSPKKPKNYISYAEMLAKESRQEEAFENYDKASKLLPSLDDPRLNEKHSRAIKKEKYLIEKGRGDIYFSQKEYQKSEEHYCRALDYYPSDVSLYKKIADTYYGGKEFEKAIEYNKKGYLLNNKDSVWPFSIALIYNKLGDKEKALMYAQEALELSSDNKQIKNFIDELIATTPGQ